MATNSFDDNAPSLSTSIPSENHSNAHLTDTDFDLTAPAAPEDGAPENLEGGRPVYNRNITPVPADIRKEEEKLILLFTLPPIAGNTFI